jgi:hypothetical protein
MKKEPALKIGDKVVMANCGEAEHYPNKVWICRSDSYYSKYGTKEDLVFLEGFAGSFLVDCLKISL